MLWHCRDFLSRLFHAQFLASQIFIEQNPAALQHYLRSVKFFILLFLLKFSPKNTSRECYTVHWRMEGNLLRSFENITSGESYGYGLSRRTAVGTVCGFCLQ
jgi:hypothetical protein